MFVPLPQSSQVEIPTTNVMASPDGPLGGARSSRRSPRVEGVTPSRKGSRRAPSAFLPFRQRGLSENALATRQEENSRQDLTLDSSPFCF